MLQEPVSSCVKKCCHAAVHDSHLGKNRDSQPYPPAQAKTYPFTRPAKPDYKKATAAPSKGNGKKHKRKNEAYACLAQACRLCVNHWHKHGENLKSSSCCGCGRWACFGDPDEHTVKIMADVDFAKYINSFKCKCAYSCEVCAEALSSKMRSWLAAEVFPCLVQNGFGGSMFTLTLHHSYEEDWALVPARLKKAFKLFDSRMGKLYDKIGCVGKVRSLEATVGKNGLHAHFHVLVTHKADAAELLKSLSEKIRDKWNQAVVDVGGVTNQHGFDLKVNCLNTYLAKVQARHEMSAHNTKSAKRNGKSLRDLLMESRHNLRAGQEWVRAIQALAGEKRFTTGKLAENLGITKFQDWRDEDEDEQEEDAGIIDREDEKQLITYPRWMHLKATDPASKRAGLALILRAARKGGQTGVELMVSALIADLERQKLKKHGKFADAALRAVLEKAKKSILSAHEIDTYLEAKRRLKLGETPAMT